MKNYIEIFLTALRLGVTAFGGPVAHLAYFQEEYVKRKKWLSDQAYADLVALCQFLPGPASSQVGISVGMVRGGILGGILAWIGFTLPSVLLLVFFAAYVLQFDVSQSVWISGLKIVAVAVVAHAVLNMGKKLAPDLPRITIMLLAAVALLLFPFSFVQIIIILVAAIVGLWLFKDLTFEEKAPVNINISKKVGILSLTTFTALLIGLPILSQATNVFWLQIVDIFYRVGSLVFGGGHVVLPLLERELVPKDLLTEEMFLAGYGAAQAIPGPLFTFSSYLGQVISGLPGAALATLAIFLPSFLLIIGILPFWDSISHHPKVRAGLLAVNAAVVGILIAAFYDPIFTSGINDSIDFAVALAAFCLLHFWKKPAWLVVIVTVLGYVALKTLL
ncbi:chromate efflux transporter [Halalkalibacillus sediminis]